jgi:hypothetical protein
MKPSGGLHYFEEWRPYVKSAPTIFMRQQFWALLLANAKKKFCVSALKN